MNLWFDMTGKTDETPGALAHLREAIAAAFAARIDDASLRERLLLAVHEVVSNLLRHPVRKPTHISLEFLHEDGKFCCLIRDDATPFTAFPKYWQRAKENAARPFFDSTCKGLTMIRRLWPQAVYRIDADQTNVFVLPLTQQSEASVPAFFRTADANDFARMVTRLVMEGA